MKEFPNNWQAVADSPSEYFPQIDYNEFLDWKVHGWEIPSSIECIFRAENKKTGKITEHVYKNMKSAHNKIVSLMKSEHTEITIVNHDSIHLICNADSTND